MYKFFDIDDKWKKGFITHKDREHLHFIVIGKIARVISNKENFIDKWAKRVGVTEITDEKAEADIKQLTLNGLINTKAQLENELVDVKSKIKITEVS